MKLSEIVSQAIGRNYTLIRLEGAPLLVERLMEMGLSPGVEIQVTGQLPFNGPITIRTSSLNLALRHDEAAALFLESQS